MVMEIDSEMIVAFALSKHSEVTDRQLETMRKRILSEINEIILLDFTLRGLQELKERLPNALDIECEIGCFKIKRPKNYEPWSEKLLDDCHSAFFPGCYEQIKKILTQE